LKNQNEESKKVGAFERRRKNINVFHSREASFICRPSLIQKESAQQTSSNLQKDKREIKNLLMKKYKESFSE